MASGNSRHPNIVGDLAVLLPAKIHLHHRRLGDPLSYAGSTADLGSHLDILQLTGCGGLGRVGGMSRPLRIERAGGWYHLTGRGNERRAIFRDHRDRQHFCELLAS